jgi:cobalt-zinc-cadmium efflux system outer membrane protein
MKRVVPVAILLSLVASIGFGLTLEEAVTRAIENNPALRSAMRDWEAAESEKTRVTALPDPMVELGVGQTLKDYDGSMQSIGIVQPVPFPAKIVRARSRADMAARAAEAGYASRRRQIARDVKVAYVDLILITETIDIYEEDLVDIGILENATRQKYEVGRAMQHDLVKAQLEALILQNNIQILKQDDLVEAAVGLRTLLNLDEDDSVGNLEKPDIEFSKLDLDALRSIGTAESPEVEARSYRLEAARRDLSLAKMQWIPDFRVRVFKEEMDMLMGRHQARGIMLSLNVPVWAWSNNAAIDKKRYLREAAEADLEAKQDAVELALERAVASVTAARESYNLYQDSIIPEANLAYSSARTAYETGKMDVLSVISAQRALREARLSQLRVWNKLARGLAEIERITGRRFY